MKCVPSNRELLTDSEYYTGFSPSRTKNFKTTSEILQSHFNILFKYFISLSK